ncbi:hypothetical protein M569_06269 [Genlisea aurea]|uniref:Uncharacterized protein n=1 Tax=Genlisea aurea TaxID=192259 RepID=S8CMV2_9LAMI|nr:hypothetical protein M569_06269 [Genlisea aurea]
MFIICRRKAISKACGGLSELPRKQNPVVVICYGLSRSETWPSLRFISKVKQFSTSR